MALFKDRSDAGQRLARDLQDYEGRDDVLVLALPRGGVPVALEVARVLKAPLDIFIVRKLGVPGQEELAMGAIASGGVRVLNEGIVRSLQITPATIDAVAAEEQREVERREQAYRGDRPKPDVRGKVIVLVDDGLATGASMRAAVAALKAQGPARIVVAVPTAAPEVCKEFAQKVDQVVCTATPQPFFGVGFWYDDFRQISDEEVRRLFDEAATRAT